MDFKKLKFWEKKPRPEKEIEAECLRLTELMAKTDPLTNEYTKYKDELNSLMITMQNQQNVNRKSKFTESGLFKALIYITVTFGVCHWEDENNFVRKCMDRGRDALSHMKSEREDPLISEQNKGQKK